MIFDFQKLSGPARYKLLTGVVVPRPIAWVTSRNEDGLLDLAPFSFFNVVGSDPGLVILSIGNHPDRPKDTATNIAKRGEFVVNMVDDVSAEAMSLSAIDFPAEMSEVDTLALKTTASSQISTPRLTNAPAAIECRKHSIIEIGRNRLLLGEVVAMYIRDELMKDASKYYVDSDGLRLVGRMGGLGGYCYTDHGFEIPRKTFADWKSEHE